MLRKTRSVANSSASTSVAAATSSGSGSSSPKDGKSTTSATSTPSASATSSNKNEAGYDFIEGSGFVIEGLEDKGLDAKSYIQHMLRRTDGSSREEQLLQKEQILAELQRVERELQEKAHAHAMLSR